MKSKSKQETQNLQKPNDQKRFLANTASKEVHPFGSFEKRSKSINFTTNVKGTKRSSRRELDDTLPSARNTSKESMGKTPRPIEGPEEICELIEQLKRIPKKQFKAYIADGMEVNKVLMKGIVAKHIERRNIFHSNDVHWKLLVVKLQG